MKRIAIWTDVFVAGVLLLDFAFGWFADGLMSRSGFRFARLYGSRRLAYDVVVVGNSRAVNSFNALKLSSLTGLSWLNLGYNGVSPELVEALLFDYLDRHEKPRLVVFEVTNTWQGMGPLRDLRPFVRKSDRLRALDVEGGWLMRLARRSALFSCNGEIFLRMCYYLGRSDQDWVNSGRMDPARTEAMRAVAGRTLSETIPDSSVETYRRIFSALRERKIPFCCAMGPYFMDRADVEKVRRVTAQAIPADVPLVDSAEEIPDVDCFADPLHLNRRGSERYAEMFLVAPPIAGVLSTLNSQPSTFSSQPANAAR